tara:strand:+ start:134 stop:682 length:549 start_codon:yes stop_codon:yes gene_type:complete
MPNKKKVNQSNRGKPKFFAKKETRNLHKDLADKKNKLWSNIIIDNRTDKSEPFPAEVQEVIEMFKNGAFKTCDGKRIMINKELAMVYDYCFNGMNGMNMEWFDNAEKWIETQIERGLDTFDKMKCYWTRVGATKKNIKWYGEGAVNARLNYNDDFGMCIMAGACFGLPPTEWASARDPLEMD